MRLQADIEIQNLLSKSKIVGGRVDLSPGVDKKHFGAFFS